MADFSTVRKEDCRTNPVPAKCRLTDSRTVVLQSVINGIKEHGRSSMHEEVCGVLVGSLCWDGGPYLFIDAWIEGKHASHQSGSVTFTSETWDFIHEELAGKHPDRKIVGWYHTHPGFGIFLSNMDAFIHENFFSFPWQPAYVFDPQAETDGFFFRTNGELRQEDVSIAPDAEPIVKEPMLPPSDPPDRIVIEDERFQNRLWLVITIAASLLLCLGALAFVLFDHLREKEEIGRVAETQIENLRDDVARREEQIRRHKTEEAEWIVRQKTYEKEIDGLRVRITEITSERRDLETENERNRAELARLKNELARLEGVLDGNARELANLGGAKERAEADLATARAEVAEMQKRLLELETTVSEPSADESTPVSQSVTVQETGSDKSHWYDVLKFWNWFD